MTKFSVKRVSPKPEKKLAHVLFVLFVVAVVCSCLLIQSWQTHGFSSAKQTRIWFFDVGQGDAIFLQSQDGEQMLIDGGPDDSVLTKLGDVLLPWDRTLDAVVFTHPDADHITGLIGVFERYKVDRVYETGMRSNTRIMKNLEQAILDEGAQNIIVGSGDDIAFSGARIRVSSPSDVSQSRFAKETNEFSLVLLLTCPNGATVLLTGDATEAVEPAIASASGKVDVLKIGHHGSAGSSSYDFLHSVLPNQAVISVGEKNSYGHPHPIIIERLQNMGVDIFRTDEDGDILFECGQEEYSIYSNPLTF